MHRWLTVGKLQILRKFNWIWRSAWRHFFAYDWTLYIQKTSVLQRVNEVPKIFFLPKSCLKWVYFSIVYFSISRRKMLLARKKFFHVTFVNPLQPRPEYIRDSMWEIQHIDRRSYFSWINFFRHLTTFSASAFNLQSIGGNFRSFEAILTKLWPF